MFVDTKLTAVASEELEKQVKKELGMAEGEEFDMGELLKKLEENKNEDIY